MTRSQEDFERRPFWLNAPQSKAEPMTNESNSPASPVTLEQHTKAVGDWLNELYAVMVDPCAEGVLTIKQMCDAIMASAELCRELAGSQDAGGAASGGQGEPQKYDDVLVPFVAAMRKELHANTRKGDRPGWLTMDANTALLEVYWHAAKLSAAVKNNDGPAIQEHSADVANMAMMVLDICGGLAWVDVSQEADARADALEQAATLVELEHAADATQGRRLAQIAQHIRDLKKRNQS